ncbi:MAG TPA: mechanosensitive ion channel [Bacteroidetes bacterium]|nr:mechanosensitive ion channel [Bacteroidota bacterium]
MEKSSVFFNRILSFELVSIGEYILTVNKLVSIFLIVVVTKLILWAIIKALYKRNAAKSDHKENLYALIQIIKYVVWIIASVIVLDTIGIKVTMLLTGSAALLVGVGLGLQQTFNDFVSGIILLFEGKTKVGDILEVEGEVLMLKKIGLRSTEGINRDNISIIIPNSKITTDKVINWTHQGKKTRFKIAVGVAYGSEIELVVKVLEECAKGHAAIMDKENVEGRLVDFGDSALNFQLLFFSQDVFRIEKVKSELRKRIHKKFLENGIAIPYPQVDLHFRT